VIGYCLLLDFRKVLDGEISQFVAGANVQFLFDARDMGFEGGHGDAEQIRGLHGLNVITVSYTSNAFLIKRKLSRKCALDRASKSS